MNTSLTQLSNRALLDQLKRLVQHEREATATLVAHLAEVKKRKLYLGEGYGSMFRYCTRVLHLSEHATYLRLEAAKMVQRFPVILTALEAGELNLTSIRLLAPNLTAENLDELVAAARHRTRAEVEAFLASRFPRPDVPTVVRKLPGKNVGSLSMAMPVAAPMPARTAHPPAFVTSTTSSLSAVPQSATWPVVEPLAPERYKVQFTANEATHARLRRAQDLLRHRIPNGDVAQVMELALTLLVEKLEKQKLAETDQPRPDRGTAANSRTIPASVRRAVWKRDGGQCGFVGTNSHRCAETGFLEFHHVVPFARGGAATIANIQLRCRAHNQFEGFLEFGPRSDVVRESDAPWGSTSRVPWQGNSV